MYNTSHCVCPESLNKNSTFNDVEDLTKSPPLPPKFRMEELKLRADKNMRPHSCPTEDIRLKSPPIPPRQAINRERLSIEKSKHKSVDRKKSRSKSRSLSKPPKDIESCEPKNIINQYFEEQRNTDNIGISHSVNNQCRIHGEIISIEKSMAHSHATSHQPDLIPLSSEPIACNVIKPKKLKGKITARINQLTNKFLPKARKPSTSHETSVINTGGVIGSNKPVRSKSLHQISLSPNKDASVINYKTSANVMAVVSPKVTRLSKMNLFCVSPKVDTRNKSFQQDRISPVHLRHNSEASKSSKNRKFNKEYAPDIGGNPDTENMKGAACSSSKDRSQALPRHNFGAAGNNPLCSCYPSHPSMMEIQCSCNKHKPPDTQLSLSMYGSRCCQGLYSHQSPGPIMCHNHHINQHQHTPAAGSFSIYNSSEYNNGGGGDSSLIPNLPVTTPLMTCSCLNTHSFHLRCLPPLANNTVFCSGCSAPIYCSTCSVQLINQSPLPLSGRTPPPLPPPPPPPLPQMPNQKSNSPIRGASASRHNSASNNRTSKSKTPPPCFHTNQATSGFAEKQSQPLHMQMPQHLLHQHHLHHSHTPVHLSHHPFTCHYPAVTYHQRRSNTYQHHNHSSASSPPPLNQASFACCPDSATAYQHRRCALTQSKCTGCGSLFYEEIGSALSASNNASPPVQKPRPMNPTPVGSLNEVKWQTDSYGPSSQQQQHFCACALCSVNNRHSSDHNCGRYSSDMRMATCYRANAHKNCTQDRPTRRMLNSSRGSNCEGADSNDDPHVRGGGPHFGPSPSTHHHQSQQHGPICSPSIGNNFRSSSSPLDHQNCGGASSNLPPTSFMDSSFFCQTSSSPATAGNNTIAPSSLVAQTANPGSPTAIGAGGATNNLECGPPGSDAVGPNSTVNGSTCTSNATVHGTSNNATTTATSTSGLAQTNAVNVTAAAAAAAAATEPWRQTFHQNMLALRNLGWYWGPLNYLEAENLVHDRPDGTFLVRDSGHDTYFLSLTFRVLGTTYHTRIEYSHGKFSFWSQPESHSAATIVEFIDKAVAHSQSGKFHYFLQTSIVGQPAMEVSLLYPLSRHQLVQPLKHLARFVILSNIRKDHVNQLNLPAVLKEFLREKQIYVDNIERFVELTRNAEPLTYHPSGSGQSTGGSSTETSS